MTKTNADTEPIAPETREMLVVETVQDLRNYDWTDGDNALNINTFSEALAEDANIPIEDAIEIVSDAVDIVAAEDVDEVIDETSLCLDDEEYVVAM